MIPRFFSVISIGNHWSTKSNRLKFQGNPQLAVRIPSTTKCPTKKQKRPNPDLKTGGFSSKIYITLIYNHSFFLWKYRDFGVPPPQKSRSTYTNLKGSQVKFLRVFSMFDGNWRGPPLQCHPSPHGWKKALVAISWGVAVALGASPLDSHASYGGQVSILLKPSIGFIHACSLKDCSLKKSWFAVRVLKVGQRI